MVSKNPLDNLDFSAPEFKAGVQSLADFLKITKVGTMQCTEKSPCKKYQNPHKHPKILKSLTFLLQFSKGTLRPFMYQVLFLPFLKIGPIKSKIL